MLVDDSQFRLLYVCTGNIHRSAMAERLTLSRIDDSLPVTVISAGMRAMIGHPMGKNSMIAVAELGGDPSDHVARQFVPQLADRADLILTAELSHRRRILEDCPRAAPRMFSIRGVARAGQLLEPSPRDAAPFVDRVRSHVQQLAALRTAPDSSDDIADPVRAGLDETRHIARELASHVDALVVALGLAAGDQP